MLEDTIAAVGTAPGESGIGIIRISGKLSIDILDRLFKSKRWESVYEIPSRYMAYGYIIDSNGQIIDEVLSVIMKGPYSYTAEDLVEIHCHGGIIPIKKIMNMVLKEGARLAEAGEFTKRAFLNGRIDLTQAEAVIDIITAKTDTNLTNALDQLHGSLSYQIKEVMNILLSVISHIEASIDFPEHDIEEMTLENVKSNTQIVKEKVKGLLSTYDEGKIQKEGLNTAIIGRPNVGKSSLLNVFLKENRAIVTDIPGTTRDVIEEFFNLRGILIKLIDTAGLRETDDVVEKIGVERTREAISRADLIILIIDASEKLTKEDRNIIDLILKKDVIVALNKIDKGINVEINEIEDAFGKENLIKMSIKELKGLEDLEEAIVGKVYKGEVRSKDTFLINNVRHKALLEKAEESLYKALDAIEIGIPIDLISVDIKDAWNYLGEITGDAIEDAIVIEIFERFCIGK